MIEKYKEAVMGPGHVGTVYSYYTGKDIHDDIYLNFCKTHREYYSSNERKVKYIFPMCVIQNLMHINKKLEYVYGEHERNKEIITGKTDFISDTFISSTFSYFFNIQEIILNMFRVCSYTIFSATKEDIIPNPGAATYLFAILGDLKDIYFSPSMYSYNLAIGTDYPTVIALRFLKEGDPEGEYVFHRHSLRQIIKGMNIFLTEVGLAPHE